LCAELHDRQVAGHLQRELVAVLALGFGGSAGGLHDVGRHAGELFQRGVVGEGVGGVERVLAELLAQFGLPLLDRGKAFLGRALQFGAGQHEVAHGVLERLALLGSSPDASMALYLAYRRSSAPRRVQNSVTRGSTSL
jgi:hypothetical protein